MANAKFSFYGNEIEVKEVQAGGGGDIPDGSVTEQKLADDVKQDINSRATEAALQVVDTKVDDLSAVQNVVDVVADLTALNAYDTTKLAINDKIEVLSDSSQGGRATIYNWDGTAWGYVGAYGNIITGVKGSSESTYRTGNVSISKTDIGLASVENRAMDNTPTANSQNYVRSGGVKSAIDAINQVTPEDQMKLDAIDVVEDYGDNWSAKTWLGELTTSFNASYIWTDGDNIYYSVNTKQYVLNKSTSTWETKTWSGLTDFSGEYIWTDGDNIYYSPGTSSGQRVLNKSTSTWETKTWSGFSNPNGQYIWTDGTNIYYSNGSNYQYRLNKETSTWTNISYWQGVNFPEKQYIWTDGDDIYYSYNNSHWILNKQTSTWVTKTFNGTSGALKFQGTLVWTDGKNTYWSSYSLNEHYVLNKETSTWTAKTWTGLTVIRAGMVWKDNDNVYYSYTSSQYVLDKTVTGVKFPADQTYNATSENPQSGKAVAEAIAAAITDALGGDY